MIQNILIPIALFAVTATGVSAYQTGFLEKLDIDLTDAQVTALEKAETIREEAHAEAEAVLESAGIDEEKMREIHQAMREEVHAAMDAVKEAIENKDYEAFKVAVVDTPLAEAINTEEEFNKLVEAHALREAGDKEGARAIMETLDIEHGMGGFLGGHGHPGRGGMQEAE